MPWQAWVTVIVTLCIFIALIRNVAAPDMLFLGATALFALCGIISPTEAFSGFSNPGVITVALLFVIAAALRETGVLDHISHRLLGSVRTERGLLGRLAFAIVPMSAFLNNTPIVAMFMPIVVEWCRRNRISPSRLLLPLSYLTILGGTLTLIGTSTNLVTQGLMVKNNMEPMSLFEIGKAGLPHAVIGIAYILFMAPRILPVRKELLEQLGESRREYLLEMQVLPGCRLAGKSVESAGLRHLPGLFLIEINREQSIIAPVSPDDIIQVGDRLIFTGVVGSIVELDRIPGLVPAADSSYEISPSQQIKRQLCEAVISSTSPLIGKTIRDADFRSTYGAAIVAVHRGGERIIGKVGDIVLRPGDTLLLQVRTNFMRSHRNDPAFYLISDVPEWRPLRRDRAWIAGLLFAGLLILMTTNVVSTEVAGAIIAMLMIAFGCISSGDARRSIDWQVLVTIASAFGLGAALQNSGASASIASGFFSVTESWGPVAAIACVYLLAAITTEIITNNAVVVLLFPICVDIAKLYAISPRPLLIALTLAASASFMTPIGYQTNLMVYGPGGYRFWDYFRFGAPLALILWPVAVTMIYFLWSF